MQLHRSTTNTLFDTMDCRLGCAGRLTSGGAAHVSVGCTAPMLLHWAGREHVHLCYCTAQDVSMFDQPYRQHTAAATKGHQVLPPP